MFSPPSMKTTAFLVPSYPHLTSSPGIHRMFNGSNIGRFIIAVTPRRILGNDLFNRHQVPLLDIEREDEHVPLTTSLLPTFHLRLPTPIEIHTGTIRDTALIAQRKRFACLPRCAERAFVEEEGERIHRVDACPHPIVIERLA